MPDAALKAPVLGGRQEGQARRGRLRRRLPRAARAPERARRAGRPPPRHRRHQDPRDGLRRLGQAVAPEGHRPRPRRLQPLADLDRGRHRVRAPAALLHLQGQPQGAACRAAQRALAARLARLARRRRCPLPSTAPKTSRRWICSRTGASPVPRSSRSPPRSPTRRSPSATSPAWRCWRMRMWASPTSSEPPRWCSRRPRSTRSPRAPVGPARTVPRRTGAKRHGGCTRVTCPTSREGHPGRRVRT